MGNFAQNEDRVLAVAAHPDDVEFSIAGTLALLHSKGCEIYIATICNGDKGSATFAPEEIASIRFREATEAARILNSTFETLGNPDLALVFENTTRTKVTELIREIDPYIVFTSSPDDYMPDHEITSNLLWDACFNASVPNYKTGQPNSVAPTKRIPYLYYADSSDSVDRYGKRIIPDFYVDITSVIELKEEMLSKHESQRSWLNIQHGISDYLSSMKRRSQARGKEVQVDFAETFRQHKCPPFHSDNVLNKIIPEYLLSL